MATDSSKEANFLNAQFFKNFNSNNVGKFTFRELLNFNFDSRNYTWRSILCLENEVLLYLRDLYMNKSTGADGISAV